MGDHPTLTLFRVEIDFESRFASLVRGQDFNFLKSSTRTKQYLIVFYIRCLIYILIIEYFFIKINNNFIAGAAGSRTPLFSIQSSWPAGTALRFVPTDPIYSGLSLRLVIFHTVAGEAILCTYSTVDFIRRQLRQSAL